MVQVVRFQRVVDADEFVDGLHLVIGGCGDFACSVFPFACSFHGLFVDVGLTLYAECSVDFSSATSVVDDGVLARDRILCGGVAFRALLVSASATSLVDVFR